MIKQTNKLATILGLGGLNGSVSLAALAGLFRLENVFVLSILFLAGPAAVLTAVMLEGAIKERMLTALLAGIIATIIVMLAASVGPKLLEFVNINMLKIIGGVAILFIGLLIMGVKIPEKTPIVIMVIGIIMSFIWR